MHEPGPARRRAGPGRLWRAGNTKLRHHLILQGLVELLLGVHDQIRHSEFRIRNSEFGLRCRKQMQLETDLKSREDLLASLPGVPDSVRIRPAGDPIWHVTQIQVTSGSTIP